MAHEAVVISGQTKKAAQTLNGGTFGPVIYALDLERVNRNSQARNDMSQIINLGLGK